MVAGFPHSECVFAAYISGSGDTGTSAQAEDALLSQRASFLRYHSCEREGCAKSRCATINWQRTCSPWPPEHLHRCRELRGRVALKPANTSSSCVQHGWMMCRKVGNKELIFTIAEQLCQSKRASISFGTAAARSLAFAPS